MTNDFDITERLARGDTSDVFAASQDGEDFALKVLHPHLADDPIVRSRFIREAEALVGIRHPHIVHVHGLHTHEGRPAIVMELLTGGTLSGRRLDVEEAVALARSLLGALSVIHEAGIVHRDIRPSHVLFDRAGVPHLIGFGMASIRDLSGLTRSTVITARPTYADPYSWGSSRREPSQDLYSLGAVLFELLSGSPPPRSLFARNQSQCVQALEAFQRANDHFIATIVTLLLEHPQRRPRTAREVCDWIEAGTSSGGRSLTECLFCQAPMPSESALCLACGREPLVVERDPSGEFLALESVLESQAVLSPFLRKLALLSDGSYEIPRLLTGDISLYSRAERRSGVKLPVRIAECIASASIEPLIKLLEGVHRTEILITRYPMMSIHRVRRGPLVRLREGTVVPPATLSALTQLVDSRPVADPPGTDGMHRDARYAVAVAASRLGSSGASETPLDESTVRALIEHFEAALAQVEASERYLASVSLHASYAQYERASLSGTSVAVTLQRIREVFQGHAQAERDAVRMRQTIMEACRRLEAARPQSFIDDVREVGRMLDRCRPS